MKGVLSTLSDKGFRNAILSLAVKTIKLRYKNSLLGVFWSMLNPLIFLVIMLLIFREIASIPNYALYALSGLVFWNFLSASVLQVLTSFIDNAAILKSINLHPISFPLSATLAAIFNLLLSLIPFSILMFFLGYRIDISIIAILPVLFVSSVFILGLGMFLGTTNVYFRDVQLLWISIMPAFFYFTPIAYTIDIIPVESQKFIKLNPFYYFMECYHDIFYYSRFPDVKNFIICTIMALIVFGLGLYFFNKYRKGFISNI
ncbi:MAG: ABC transporter permease [Bacteroidetes bacterium]|nr:ABC transporter permease [Bacteroidota bacterium]